ncbi:hypothetical protein D3C84_760100 [compost metagenome]
MRLGRIAIALSPLDRALERLIQELTGHDRQHDLSENRHEHRHHVQSQHADFQQMVELFRPHFRIDVSRGDRMAAGIGDRLGAVLFVEVGPQVRVGGPDAVHAFAIDPERIEIGIFDRFALAGTLWRQFLDPHNAG